MKLDKVLMSYVNKGKGKKYKREIGRYWASDLYRIKNRYLTPENFFEKQEIEIEGCRMILTGIAMEDMLTKIFENQEMDCLPQEKNVLKISDEISLVVKPDYVFKDFVVETKFPFSAFNPYEIPRRYEYQLECEYRAFEPREVYLALFSVPFNLTFIPYTPSQRRWKNIQKVLLNFHAELKEYLTMDAHEGKENQ